MNEEVFVLWPQGSNCSYICQTSTTQRSITQAHLLAAPSSSSPRHPPPSHSPLPCHLCGGALNIEEPEAAWLAYKGCSLPCLPHSASCSALHSPFTPGSPCPPPPPLFSSPSQSTSCFAFFSAPLALLSVSSPSPP